MTPPDGLPPDVFAPAKLGPAELRNRIIKAATFEGSTPNGEITDRLIGYHMKHAAGGVGMSTVAYCAVAPEGRTDRNQILLRREAVPGLRTLTDAIHGEGAAASAQLGHAGPVANAKSNAVPALAPRKMFSPLGMRFMKAATADDLARVVRDHADGAVVAADAGFDAVELHFGHNYLVSSMFSPLLNKRDDRYGGSVENRARLARDIARAVREAVGDRVAITAKLNMEDGVPGGLHLAESIHIGQLLQDDGALDAMTLTAGSSLLNPMFLFTGEAPIKEFAAQFPQPMRLGIRLGGKKFLREYPFEEAYLLERARKFREQLTMPLILLGGVTGKATMDRAMAEGFSFVQLARALLYEPDLPKRLQQDASTPSLCTHCNKCMPTIYTGTHCVLAPESVLMKPGSARGATRRSR